MPVTSSGAISLEDVQTEFGGSNPIGIEEYYRGGSAVDNITANAAVPTSGQIQLDDFYGTREADTFTSSLYDINTNNFWSLAGYSSWTSVPSESWTFAKTTDSYSKSISVPYNNFALSVPAVSVYIRSDNADQGNAQDDWSGIRNIGLAVYNSNGAQVASSRDSYTSYNSETVVTRTIPALSTTLSAGTYYLRWIADIYRNGDDAPVVRFDLVANQTATWVSA